MRSHRNFETNRCYHLISRIAHRSFFLDGGEKTRLVEYLWRAAEFCGVTVIAFCIITNHFHVIAYVPYMEGLSDEEVLRRVRKRDLVVEQRYRRFEAELTRNVPHLVEWGSDKVAFDLLRLLSEGVMRPSDLRERLGVMSRSYFTNRNLSPLVASGYVEMTEPLYPRSSAQSYRLTARGRKVVA